ncbi:MAG: phosphonate monoester hydrolase, partial [Pseudomonadota bacterium]
ISEFDYGGTPPAAKVDVAPREAALVMVFDGRWKAMFAKGFRAMLFDLQSDPEELFDLGADPAFAGEVARLEGHLNAWLWRRAQRTTVSEAQMRARRKTGPFPKGVIIGVPEAGDIDPKFVEKYVGPAPERRK